VVSGVSDNGRPRLLAATGPLLLTPLGWVLDAIADAGFRAAEIMLGHNPDSRDPAQVMRYAAEAGLEIPVVHGPYLVLLRTVLGTGYIDKSRRSLELAAEMGAGVVVAHAPFRWERKALGWLASEADNEAAGHGTRLAMENLFPVAGRGFSAAITPGELSPYRHVVFDTSHFAVAGIDLFEAWDALAPRVVHLHVSDNFGNGRDSHAPLGSGTLPLGALVAHVCRSGYRGTITLELDCRAYLDSRASLVGFLERERIKAEAMLASAEEDAEMQAQDAR
jgi:sugar phosphate isomerase/epimerase